MNETEEEPKVWESKEEKLQRLNKLMQMYHEDPKNQEIKDQYFSALKQSYAEEESPKQAMNMYSGGIQKIKPKTEHA